jgi:hypothetical protein
MKITPFSNGTEAMEWVERNCDVCRTKSGCSARLNIEKGFITGEITVKAAVYIGQEYGELYPVCQHKNTRSIIRKKKRIISGDLLF